MIEETTRLGTGPVAVSPYAGSSNRNVSTSLLPSVLRRTAWGAMFASALAACGLQMIFAVLGIALGLTAASNSDGTTSTVTDAGTKAAVWWLITGTISILSGGLVLGRIAGINRSCDLMLHSFTMWCLIAVIGAAVVSGGLGVGLRSFGSRMQPLSYGALQTGYDRQGTNRSFIDGNPQAGTREDTSIDRRSTDNTDRSVNSGDVAAAADTARKAAWWTLFALILGIAAALGGTWLAAPDRSLVVPSSAPMPG